MTWKSSLTIGMQQSTSVFSTAVTHASKLSHLTLLLKKIASGEVSGHFIVFDGRCSNGD